MAEKYNNQPVVDARSGALKGAASRNAILVMLFLGLAITGTALLFLNQSKGSISDLVGQNKEKHIVHDLAQSFSLNGITETKIKYVTSPKQHPIELPDLNPDLDVQHRIQTVQADVKQLEQELRRDREQSVRENAFRANRLSTSQIRLLRQNKRALAQAQNEVAQLRAALRRVSTNPITTAQGPQTTVSIAQLVIKQHPVKTISVKPKTDTEHLPLNSFVFGDTIFSLPPAPNPQIEDDLQNAVLSEALEPVTAETPSNNLAQQKVKTKPEKGFILVNQRPAEPRSQAVATPLLHSLASTLQDRLLIAQSRVLGLEAQQTQLSQVSLDSSPQFYARQARQAHLANSLMHLKNDLLALENADLSSTPNRPTQPAITLYEKPFVETRKITQHPMPKTEPSVVERTITQSAQHWHQKTERKPAQSFENLLSSLKEPIKPIVHPHAQKASNLKHNPQIEKPQPALPNFRTPEAKPVESAAPQRSITAGGHLRFFRSARHRLYKAAHDLKHSPWLEYWPPALLALLGLGYVLFSLQKNQKASRQYIGQTLHSVCHCRLPWVPDHQWKYHRERHRLEVTTELIPEFNDALEALAQNLQAERLEGGERILLACSLEHDGGQPSLLANLALCLAENGARVLLIDTHLERPRLHESFQHELDYERSLPELLNWLAERRHVQQPHQWQSLLDQKLHQFITPSGINENLAYLNAGCSVDDSLEFIQDEGLGAIIQAAKVHYDWVILTSPPMLAQQAELQALSQWVEGLLIFVERGSKRGSIRKTAEMIAPLERSIVATIVRQK